jgi:arylsulfatase A-like enzyme
VQDNDPRQFIYDPAYQELFESEKIPVPLTADPKYFQKFPEFFKTDNEARRRWDIRFSTPEKYQASDKGYYRLIYGVDAVLGRIRKKLDDLHMADNTVIVYSSDNGFYLGEHGLAGKWYGHEESIRVPLILFDPRLHSGGQVRDQMALNIDIAPTLLSLAGVKIPDSVQGYDLMPIVQGKRVAWRDDFFYEHLFNHARIPKSIGVITQRFKYLRYPDQNPVYEELYDFKNDSHETMNLISDPDSESILEKLRKRCDELEKSVR